MILLNTGCPLNTGSHRIRVIECQMPFCEPLNIFLTSTIRYRFYTFVWLIDRRVLIHLEICRYVNRIKKGRLLLEKQIPKTESDVRLLLQLHHVKVGGLAGFHRLVIASVCTLTLLNVLKILLNYYFAHE